MHRKLSLLVALLLGAVSLQSAEPESLFNGRDLAGWSGLPQFWSVRDGVIVGETTADKPTAGNTFLIWQGGKLADFEITCQVRFRGNNSGLQYRSEIVDETGHVLAGYQADLHPKAEYFGMLYGEKMGKRGIIAQRGQRVVIGPDQEVQVVGKVGDETEWIDWEWNTLRVVAVGDRLVHQVNGITTVDVTDRHPEARRDGVLGLQLHAGPPMRVEFKEIRLRRLAGQEARTTLEEALAAKAPAARPPSERSAGGRFAWVSEEPKANWIWRADVLDDEWIFLRKSFDIPGEVKSARLYATCDNELELWINGLAVGGAPDWGAPILSGEAAQWLRPGKNLIAAKARNRGGIAAFHLKLEYEGADGAKHQVLSGKDWKLALAEVEGWRSVDFDDAAWTAPLKELGPFGVKPWGIAGLQGPGGNRASAAPLDPSEITLPEGFQVELLYTVPKESQGSWVSLAQDPSGRLYAADQGDKGLYRIAFPEKGGVQVEKIPVALSGAQGLVWFEDTLWFNQSGGALHRLRDADGDGLLDSAVALPSVKGGGEHGTHGIVPTEEGGALYFAAGNFTDPPAAELLAGARVTTWAEDLLLPRMWDARGHARGRLAPGGWTSRYDPRSQKHELYAIGFRNHYDFALNRHGDLFTFDSDMEWDMGMPWYVPTRICHVVSGGDFGWRSGSGRWPAYYEDSLPAVVDIGPGSPTGLVSGQGARFPRRYQEAIFALDWTFGTIYAIHLEAKGSSYVGHAEPFLYGTPLPLTDAVVGNDGALYFLIGGRNTQSALYRVRYTGPLQEEAPPAESADFVAMRALRRELERFHGKEDAAAVAQALPHLGSADRFLRHAARLALESQPVAQWADQVLSAEDLQTRITGAVALARQGDPETHRLPLTSALLGIDPAALDESQLLGWLRAWQLNLIRFGKPTEQARPVIVAKLDPLLPSPSADVNVELVNLLVALEAPGVIDKALALIEEGDAREIPDWAELIVRNPGYGRTIQAMLDDFPPIRGLAYAFALRNLKTGWTLEQRRRYFTFLNAAAQHPGGASYAGFLSNTRDEALALAPNDHLKALEDLTGVSYQAVPDFPIHPPKGPGRQWTVAEALPQVRSDELKKANYENGRSLFHAIGCAACHRLAGYGGDIGPDITSIRNKFDLAYVLESIIEPSKVISDQYGSSAVTTQDGAVHTGLVVDRGDKLEIYPPDAKSAPTQVERAAVAKIEAVAVSQMPPGLIDALSGAELRDLMAYLMAAGDPQDKLYQK